MSKTSLYKNPSYCLSFGADDVVFLDLEVKIHKQSEEQFTLEIVQSKLSPTQMEFACYLVKMLSGEALKKLNDDLQVALTTELTPSLFSLYYAGTLLPDEAQTEQAS